MTTKLTSDILTRGTTHSLKNPSAANAVEYSIERTYGTGKSCSLFQTLESPCLDASDGPT